MLKYFEILDNLGKFAIPLGQISPPQNRNFAGFKIAIIRVWRTREIGSKSASLATIPLGLGNPAPKGEIFLPRTDRRGGKIADYWAADLAWNRLA